MPWAEPLRKKGSPGTAVENSIYQQDQSGNVQVIPFGGTGEQPPQRNQAAVSSDIKIPGCDGGAAGVQGISRGLQVMRSLSSF
jgi:hypothetical protein